MTRTVRTGTAAALEIGAVLAVWAAAIALIWPRGQFPLDDDWDFAIATWNFARTGAFHFTKFTAVSLRAQVLWGAAWTRLLGQSFEVLRLSTLPLAAGTIVIVNRLLARTPVSRSLRIVATLAFAFHPVFLWAACTYMTEVPFVFASALAFWFFVRALDEDRLTLFAAGCACVILSWFVRQTGVAMTLAPLALLLIFRQRLTPRWKSFAALAGATILLFVALLVIRPQWLAGSTEEFANHFKMWREATFRLPQQLDIADHYTIFNLQHIALFSLPLTLALLFRPRPRRWQLIVLAAAALPIFLRVHELLAAGHPMPYFASPLCCDIMAGNIFVDFGLGPQTVTDVWGMRHRYPFHLPDVARWLLTWGTALLATVLVMVSASEVVARWREPRANIFPLLGIAAALAGNAALIGSGLYVDRYSFDAAWTMCVVLPLFVPWEKRLVRVVTIAVLLLVATFGVLSVQEYFSWNRARWAAFDSLRARGVAVDQIDAGSEPSNLYEVAPVTQKRRRQLLWGAPRPYLLAFSPPDGYEVVETHPFRGWLGMHEGAIYTLRRGAPGSSPRP